MNRNYILRDTIIFGKDIPSYTDICHFNKLSLDQLEQLIDLEFIELDECQNDSPNTQEIYNFIKKYPNYTAHGYVVTINRKDYRTTLEGVEKDTEFNSVQEQKDFYKLFGNADELNVDNNVYCWYD